MMPAILLLALAIRATAGVGNPEIDRLWTTDGSRDHLTITPGGTGLALEDAVGVIHVRVVAASGEALVGYPAQDLVVVSVDPDELRFCVDGATADGATDANGETTFTGVLRGGGSTQSGILVEGPSVPCSAPPLPIEVNSPDLNGDLRVDVRDVGLFAGDFGASTYSFRSDLNPDGRVDLADLGVFAQALGEECP